MSKTENNSPSNFSKKIRLDPSRRRLKPADPNLTFEQYIVASIKEGEKLLAKEEKDNLKRSVKIPPSKSPSPILEKALAKMPDNTYVRARLEILNDMQPTDRAIIEKMEKGLLPKDSRYDTFCKKITIRGDQLSSNN